MCKPHSQPDSADLEKVMAELEDALNRIGRHNLAEAKRALEQLARTQQERRRYVRWRDLKRRMAALQEFAAQPADRVRSLLKKSRRRRQPLLAPAK